MRTKPSVTLTRILFVWTILRAAWEAIGHFGNFQTLQGIVGDLVKNWPTILQYAAFVAASWWLPLALTAILVAWWVLALRRASSPARARKSRTTKGLKGRITRAAYFEGDNDRAGIVVGLQITNTGPQTIVDGWLLRFELQGQQFNFAARHFPNNFTIPDVDGQRVTLKASEMVYEKVGTHPLANGGRVSGFLVFVTDGISYEKLIADPAQRLTVFFRDAFGNEYSAEHGPGSRTLLYEPGLDDPFTDVLIRQNTRIKAPVQSQDTPEPQTTVPPIKEPLEVTFDNSECLIVRVINHDPDRHAKIKSVTVLGIKNGKEKQILSTKLPNDPDVIPGGWKLGSLSLPYSLAPRDAQNFKTIILEANLRVYGNTAYFAEVTLQTGEVIRSEVIPTKGREDVIRPKLALIDQGVVGTPDRATRFFFTVKNVGPILVEKTDFAFVIQTERLAKPPVVKHEPHSQPIPEGLTRQVSYIFPTVDPEPAYIAFYISYIGEGQDIKWDNAPVFFGFRGVKGGIPNPELEYLRDEDVNRFKEYLRQHELPKPLL